MNPFDRHISTYPFPSRWVRSHPFFLPNRIRDDIWWNIQVRVVITLFVRVEWTNGLKMDKQIGEVISPHGKGSPMDHRMTLIQHHIAWFHRYVRCFSIMLKKCCKSFICKNYGDVQSKNSEHYLLRTLLMACRQRRIHYPSE